MLSAPPEARLRLSSVVEPARLLEDAAFAPLLSAAAADGVRVPSITVAETVEDGAGTSVRLPELQMALQLHRSLRSTVYGSFFAATRTHWPEEVNVSALDSADTDAVESHLRATAQPVSAQHVTVNGAARTLVAVKHFQSAKLRSLQGQENPLREIALLQTLAHEHIIELLACGLDQDNDLFLVMPMLSGDLLDLMNDAPMPSESTVRAIARQVASALSFLHRRGVAHRDVSLENIGYIEPALGTDAPPSVRLLDFGMAVQLAPAPSGGFQRTVNEGMFGKHYSAPPEAYASGEELDPREADVWSLGVVLLVLLTGRQLMYCALPSDRAFLTITQSQEGLALLLKALRLKVPRKAVDLLQRMLLPVPCHRPTMEEVLAHVWLQGDCVSRFAADSGTDPGTGSCDGSCDGSGVASPNSVVGASQSL